MKAYLVSVMKVNLRDENHFVHEAAILNAENSDGIRDYFDQKALGEGFKVIGIVIEESTEQVVKIANNVKPSLWQKIFGA